jgi:hypothetical protein
MQLWIVPLKNINVVLDTRQFGLFSFYREQTILAGSEMVMYILEEKAP